MFDDSFTHSILSVLCSLKKENTVFRKLNMPWKNSANVFVHCILTLLFLYKKLAVIYPHLVTLKHGKSSAGNSGLAAVENQRIFGLQWASGT
jgi:hypothetical protein